MTQKFHFAEFFEVQKKLITCIDEFEIYFKAEFTKSLDTSKSQTSTSRNTGYLTANIESKFECVNFANSCMFARFLRTF